MVKRLFVKRNIIVLCFSAPIILLIIFVSIAVSMPLYSGGPFTILDGSTAFLIPQEDRTIIVNVGGHRSRIQVAPNMDDGETHSIVISKSANELNFELSFFRLKWPDDYGIRNDFRILNPFTIIQIKNELASFNSNFHKNKYGTWEFNPTKNVWVEIRK